MTLKAINTLCDVNFWLALAADNHLHHQAANVALAELPKPAFCRFTQAGFVRLLTNAHAMGERVCTPSEAWAMYDKIFQNLESPFLEEPARLEDQWRRFMVEEKNTSGGTWNDAYLAAFAVCAGMELITFDRGFRRFKGLQCRIL